ncbi:hypothetical protein [Streptomyces sp. NBC_01727]|uniref:ATP dependent DNA ligase n=1 Tax=unclassified Streptomyces TaxID=2593676 RepID=UPI002E1516DE|nr:hypothetical protein OIE76_03465 [Streptomyces sp. NBC_01727]
MKFTCSHTEPAGSRSGFGALIVAYYEGDRLRYAGRWAPDTTVGSWPNCASAWTRWSASDRFTGGTVRERGVHWARSALVAEIVFTARTDDGKLRHSWFVGLRTDKPAGQVVRERPKEKG